MTCPPIQQGQSTDIHALLRMEPETALSARIKSTAAGDPPHTGALFPPPPLEADFLSKTASWDRFAAMAIHIDRADENTDNQSLHSAIQESLTALAQGGAMHWFRWDAALYGCAMKDADAPTAGRIAQQIQNELDETLLATVSVGLSEFPLDDFSRAATFENACKALDHAAFFGRASTVIFDAVSLNISGDHFYQTGRMAEAMAEYRAALRLDANDVNVYNSLGVCLAQTGEIEEAAACFEKALAIDPKEAMATYNLGVLHLLRKEDGKALAHFQNAYALDDRTFDIAFQIGKLLTEQNSYAEAKHYLEKALALNNTSAPTWSCLGQCLQGLDHIKQAIDAFKRAVKINPNDATALSRLAVLYDLKGENPDISLTFARQSVALAPENGEFRMRLAELYQKHDQLDQALSEYRSAASLGQDSTEQIAHVQSQMEAPASKKQRCA